MDFLSFLPQNIVFKPKKGIQIMEEDGQRSGAQSRVASASAARIFDDKEGQEDEEAMPKVSPSALVSKNV